MDEGRNEGRNEGRSDGAEMNEGGKNKTKDKVEKERRKNRLTKEERREGRKKGRKGSTVSSAVLASSIIMFDKFIIHVRYVSLFHAFSLSLALRNFGRLLISDGAWGSVGQPLCLECNRKGQTNGHASDRHAV